MIRTFEGEVGPGCWRRGGGQTSTLLVRAYIPLRPRSGSGPSSDVPSDTA